MSKNLLFYDVSKKESMIFSGKSLSNVYAYFCLKYNIPENMSGVPSYYFENSLRGFNIRTQNVFEKFNDVNDYQLSNIETNTKEEIRFLFTFLTCCLNLKNDEIASFPYDTFLKMANLFPTYFKQIVEFGKDEKLLYFKLTDDIVEEME